MAKENKDLEHIKQQVAGLRIYTRKSLNEVKDIVVLFTRIKEDLEKTLELEEKISKNLDDLKLGNEIDYNIWN